MTGPWPPPGMPRFSVLGRINAIIESDPDFNTKEVAKEFGMSNTHFRAARDIVFLLNEQWETDEEWADVMNAARLVLEKRVTEARKIIDPYLKMRFGHHPNLNPQQNRDRIRKQFRIGMSTLMSTMNAADEVEVPWLPEKERQEIVAELNKALRAVKRMRNTIIKGGTFNYVQSSEED